VKKKEWRMGNDSSASKLPPFALLLVTRRYWEAVLVLVGLTGGNKVFGAQPSHFGQLGFLWPQANISAAWC